MKNTYNEEQYKVISYQGILITNSGEIWYLLVNRPISAEDWQNDNERMFLACQDGGRPEQIVVNGYTLRKDARGMIHIKREEDEIKTMQLEEDVEETYNELFENLAVKYD